jgi:hypothetical protein
MSGKKLTEQQLLGEQGTSLISLAVSRMGYVWRPTSQHDTGIDGEIEIRDAASGVVSGLLLKVQSKAVSNFEGETDEGFDFRVNPRDVDYWLEHNVPVILVVSRPRTNEVYWLPVRDPSGQVRERKFHFVKSRDRLDDSAAAGLAELVRTQAQGARGMALRRQERLVSNLIPVKSLPSRLFLAETPYHQPKAMGQALKGRAITFENVVRSKQVLTVRDLTDPQYSFLCDRGTVEDFPVEQWSASNDPVAQREFVWLLNSCLRQFLRTSPGRVLFDKSSNVYFFPAQEAGNPTTLSYQGQKRPTAREVVKVLVNKKKGHIMGHRHSAMNAQFVRYGNSWYLEVSPTYIFTGPDAIRPSKYAAEWTTGIKRLERNNAVLGQLGMWAEVLNPPTDLFAEPYPHLSFGEPLTFQSDRGIDDAIWTAGDEEVPLASNELPLGLF